MRKTRMIIACLLISTSAIAADMDNRQTLTLTEGQRSHVLEEMRALLSGTRDILAALSTDDMAAVSRYARPLGLGMAHKAEDHLKSVLPREFMQLGMSLHQDFDQIAADAESKKDSKLTLRQLSDAMAKCVACHDAYQISKAPTSGQPVQAKEHGHHHHH
ncbi:hypothetical protein C8R26_12128 [Nitrosomonas oligotropha]|uniref:Cytochrome c n=1 Tax=Nitrosomonas oligotropha TaxID=42354 RepID=A0A2T5HXA9_9PROT|nr:hypothetical protein [Nitrosomonas oligotropha]PTQ76214.1 hypothetical protein C8R26_12128 [Nitrosomonas oligotropha]